MNTSTLVKKLKEKLIPTVYASSQENLSLDIQLVLEKKKSLLERYMLIVTTYDGVSEASEYVEQIRNEVKKIFSAIWMIREIGVHLIIITKGGTINEFRKSVLADKTGLHAVIIQGIHVIDLEKDEVFDCYSQWGSVRFGYGTVIDFVVNGIMKEI
jgi:hypothetical protein